MLYRLMAFMLIVLALLSTSGVAQPQDRSQNPTDGSSKTSPSDSPTADALYREALETVQVWQQPGRARTLLLQAVKLWCANNQQNRASRALIEMGDLHAIGGRAQDALECYLRAEDLHVLEPGTRARVLSIIGRIYSEFQLATLARSYLDRALGLAKSSPDSAIKAEVLSNYGYFQSARGDLKHSILTLQRAKRLAVASSDERVQSKVLLQLGRTCRALRDFVRAEESLQAALALERKLGMAAGEAQALCEMSELFLDEGRPDASLQYAGEAENLAQAAKNSEWKWRAQYWQARALRAVGKSRESALKYRQAIGQFEMQRVGYYSTDDLKLWFLGEKLSVYRDYAELLIELGRADEGLLVSEQSKSRATLDLLTIRRKERDEMGSAQQSAEQSKLAEDVSRLRTELRGLDPASSERSSLESRLSADEARFQEMELRKQMSAQRRYVPPVSDVGEIQKHVLAPGDLLLEFLLGDERSHVWLVSCDSTICVELPPRAVLEKVVADYVARLSQPPSNLYLDQDIRALRKRGAALFDLILGLVRDSLPVYKRLIIVPDGILSYLPFETLVSGGKYLVETHEISYAPSASVLRALMTPSAPSACSGERIDFLGVGNKTAGTVASRKPGFGTGKIAPSQWQFPPPDPASRVLIHAEDEVKSIARRFGASRSKVLLGPHASEPELQKEPLSCYRYIHFATHSHVDETIPSRSGLYLARGKGRAGSEFLGLDAISHLQLNSDLVVLSACQTGKGKRVEGEGIMGLARAFFMAGTRAEIASLWDLSDSSSPEFMDKFYKYLVAGEATVSALRHAKLTLISSRAAARHPFYWAPFMFFGSSH